MENNTKEFIALIVEDDETSDYLITLFIQDNFGQILHAKTGSDAVAICQNNPGIDVVLMDIKMPEMNGYTAAKLIKEFRPALTIIAQSAYALEHEKVKYGDVFDDYLVKPISEAVLLKAIRKHIHL